MNVLIPAAGMGSRFKEAGYGAPKPFIPIAGRPMIAWAMDNMPTRKGDKFYLLLRAEHMPHVLNTELAERPDVAIIPVAKLTEGAACTVMLARAFIDCDEPVLVANSDQFCRYDRDAWYALVDDCDTEGAMWTFHSTETKWSYARVQEGRVTEVAEKVVISEHATVGVYYWSSGRLLCKSVDQMISDNKRVNGEFYLCPSYNEIASGHNIRIFPVETMFGLGTPEDLERNRDKVTQSPE